MGKNRNLILNSKKELKVQLHNNTVHNEGGE